MVTALVDDMSWVRHAACRGLTHLFFPAPGDARTGSAAKAVCASCPVTTECLEYALAEQVRHGIWGGTTAEERTSIRRERVRAHQAAATTRQPGRTDACGTDAGYQAHRRRGEPACKSCRAAHAERERQRRAWAEAWA